MPIGFPHSVSPDYLPYQTYDSLQAFFSTITSLLASRALLQGLGVGDASTSATYALLLTILKDATSRVATIFFAYRVGLWIEPEAKFFRFAADVLNDSAFFLELFTPVLGDYGKIIALSCAEAFRALCGVAAGASKAALSHHFARHDNLAELNAKEASQETAVGLMGLMAGSLVVKVVQDQWSVVTLMIGLVFGHLYMNYLGVRAVCMDSLNRQRATILFDGYIREGKVLSPEEVAKRETLMLVRPYARDANGIKKALVELVVSYEEAVRALQAEDVEVLDGDNSTIIVAPAAYAGGLATVKIITWENASAKDMLRAWMMALAHVYDATASTGRDISAYATAKGRQQQITRDLGAKKKSAKSWFEGDKFWDEASDKGWYLETHSLEMMAPVRMRLAAHKKDE